MYTSTLKLKYNVRQQFAMRCNFLSFFDKINSPIPIRVDCTEFRSFFLSQNKDVKVQKIAVYTYIELKNSFNNYNLTYYKNFDKIFLPLKIKSDQNTYMFTGSPFG